MIGGRLVIDRNGLADHLHGDIMTSALICDHSQQMQAVRMLGVNGQNLPITALGLGQSTGLVVPKSIRQHAGNDLRRPLPHTLCRFTNANRLFLLIGHIGRAAASA